MIYLSHIRNWGAQFAWRPNAIPGPRASAEESCTTTSDQGGAQPAWRLNAITKVRSGGFTILEIVMVLTIIAFIAATIAVGRSVVRQSQLMGSMTDAQAYISAAGAFQQKYNGLPGDLSTAVSYWGSAAGNSGDNYTTSCYGTQGTGTQTCNGNGNGLISTSAGVNYENLLFWQHLLNAQMVQGSYTGVGNGNGAYDCNPGVNCPAGRISASGYGIAYLGIQSSATSFYDGNYGHVLVWGAHATNNYPYTAIITTAEATAFDSKYDDSQPGTGNVLTFKPATLANCANSSTAYKLASTGPQCSLIIITGF